MVFEGHFKIHKAYFFGANERPCAQSKGGKYFYSWKIRHNKVLTAFISLRIRDCLKDQCKVLTNAACVCQHYRKVRFPKVSVKYFECNKLSSTKNIHLILLNPDRTPGLFCPVLSIFFLLVFYRRYSLLVPNPHWNLTLKCQPQKNGLSLLPVWPLWAPAATAEAMPGPDCLPAPIPLVKA